MHPKIPDYVKLNKLLINKLKELFVSAKANLHR
jgi:hypothetical protein